MIDIHARTDACFPPLPLENKICQKAQFESIVGSGMWPFF